MVLFWFRANVSSRIFNVFFHVVFPPGASGGPDDYASEAEPKKHPKTIGSTGWVWESLFKILTFLADVLSWALGRPWGLGPWASQKKENSKHKNLREFI